MEPLEQAVEFFGKDLKISEIRNPRILRAITDKRLSGYNDGGKNKCSWDDDYWDQPYQEKS